MSQPPAIVRFIDPHSVPHAADLLDAEELRRAASFHFEKDRLHWIACRGGLRAILGECLGIPPRSVPIVSGPHGKPELAPPSDTLRFNLSHCEDLALVITAVSEVGIDIERLDRAPSLIGCEASFCHPSEIAALPSTADKRAAALLAIWTAKEATLKAIGTGLLHAPTRIRIDFPAGRAIADDPIPALATLRIEKLGHPLLSRHSAFAACHDSLPGIRFME